MTTGPEAFLGLPDASGQRPWDQSHLKTALYHTRTLVGRMTNIDTYRNPYGSGRVCLFTGLTFGLRGPSSWLLPSSEGLGLSPGAWGAPVRGMPRGPESFMGLLNASGLRPCDWNHLKTALCHTRTLVGCMTNIHTYRTPLREFCVLLYCQSSNSC